MQRITKEISKRIPALSDAGKFLYMKPANHSIRGFLFDQPSSIIYVYKLFIPLFDEFEYIYLSLSQRISSFDTTNLRKQDVLNELLVVVKENVFDFPETPEAMHWYLNTRSQGNASVQKIRGLLMVMSGDYESAHEELLSVMRGEGHVSGVKQGVQEIITLLEIDPDQAQRKLNHREFANRKRFGLE